MAAADVSQEQPFRFLDLFPEVRNRIYTIVVAGSYDLTNFATPAIARASQQLRAEVLPVLFAEGDFHVKMVSNITVGASIQIRVHHKLTMTCRIVRQRVMAMSGAREESARESQCPREP